MNKLSNISLLIEKYLELCEKINLDYYLYEEPSKKESMDYKKTEKFLSSNVVKKLCFEVNRTLSLKERAFVFRLIAEKKGEIFRRCAFFIENIYCIRINKKKIYLSGIDREEMNIEEKSELEKLETFREFVLKKSFLFNYIALKKEIKVFYKFTNKNIFVEENGIDIEIQREIVTSAEKFLRKTDEMYSTLFEKYKHKILKGRQKCTSGDINRLIRAKHIDKLFNIKDVRNILTSYNNVFQVYKKSSDSDIVNIQLDNESIRPFCALLNIPNNIKIVTNSNGGFLQYVDLFHEAGHYFRYKNININSTIEEKRFKDNSVEEAYAILFENIIKDKNWYFENYGVHYDESVSDYLMFIDLLILRRNFGMFLFEISICDNKLVNRNMCKKMYSEIVGNSLHIDLCEYGCCNYVEYNGKSLSYIIGSEAAIRLQHEMEKKYKNSWFTAQNMNEYLTHIWSNKQYNSILGLMELFECKNFNFDYLIKKYNEYWTLRRKYYEIL